MREQPQLELAVVGDDERVARLGAEGLSDEVLVLVERGLVLQVAPRREASVSVFRLREQWIRELSSAFSWSGTIKFEIIVSIAPIWQRARARARRHPRRRRRSGRAPSRTLAGRRTARRRARAATRRRRRARRPSVSLCAGPRSAAHLDPLPRLLLLLLNLAVRPHLLLGVVRPPRQAAAAASGAIPSSSTSRAAWSVSHSVRSTLKVRWAAHLAGVAAPLFRAPPKRSVCTCAASPGSCTTRRRRRTPPTSGTSRSTPRAAPRRALRFGSRSPLSTQIPSFSISVRHSPTAASTACGERERLSPLCHSIACSRLRSLVQATCPARRSNCTGSTRAASRGRPGAARRAAAR